MLKLETHKNKLYFIRVETTPSISIDLLCHNGLGVCNRILVPQKMDWVDNDLIIITIDHTAGGNPLNCMVGNTTILNWIR
jgi:hypothetical protein